MKKSEHFLKYSDLYESLILKVNYPQTKDLWALDVE